MSLASEPPPAADPAALPADPASYRRRKVDQRLLGPFWWGLMIGALVCIIAGVLVAKLLPQMAAKVTPAALSEPVAEPPATPASVEPDRPVAEAPAAAPIQVAALSSRLDRIEAGQRRTTEAAGAALATATLVQASQSSRPFAAELDAVRALLPESADVAALRRIAMSGAPTREGLAAAFPDAAGRTLVALRAPAGDGWTANAARALASVVTIRRIDSVQGNSADAILARAESDVNEGDVEGALRELARLPSRGKDAIATWRAQAQARVEIDRRVAAIRGQAVRSLSQTLAAAP